MKDLITMWSNTRMVALTAITAAIYAAVLIPFKVVIPIIPGITEFRPANVFPVICSLMFGPAAAWGTAFGNLIGDFFGTLGPGSFFGFLGNFLYGYIPYKIWESFKKNDVPDMRSTSKIGLYILAALVASTVCAMIVGWGVHILGLFPFSVVGNIILLNNFIVSAILGPFILFVVYPTVDRLGLIYTEIMDKADLSSGRFRNLGVALMILGGIGGMVVGNLIATNVYDLRMLSAGFGQKVVGELSVGLGMSPFVILIILAAFLM